MASSKIFRLVTVQTLLLICFSNCPLFAQNTTQVLQSDLKQFIGYWEGTLTYKNYADGKMVTIKADFEVKEDKNPSRLMVHNIYPDEPKANKKYKYSISDDGTKFNGSKVVSRETTSTGGLKIVVEFSGKDAGKKATIANTYLVEAETFVFRKEVRFEGEDEWFQRNEYSYKRR